MFLYLYQLCAVVFILQGVSLPLLVAASGALWSRHSKLFGAMAILEELVGTFFFVALILSAACVLLTLYYAVREAL